MPEIHRKSSPKQLHGKIRRRRKLRKRYAGEKCLSQHFSGLATTRLWGQTLGVLRTEPTASGPHHHRHQELELGLFLLLTLISGPCHPSKSRRSAAALSVAARLPIGCPSAAFLLLPPFGSPAVRDPVELKFRALSLRVCRAFWGL